MTGDDTPASAPSDRAAPTAPPLSHGLSRLVRMLALATGADGAAYLSFDDAEGRCLATHGIDAARVGLPSTLCRRALAQDAPVVEHDLGDFFATTRDVGTLHTYAGASVADARGTRVGVLCMVDRRRHAFRARERELLEDFRALLESELALRRLADHDPLTGLFNRRYLESAIEREWRRAQRETAPLSLLAIDIDHFKRFNDRYGHLAGDEALRAVAGALRTALRRPGDVVGRVGGEEFLACLPGTDRAGATTAGEAVRARVEQLCIPHAQSPFGVVTVSIGATTASAASLAANPPLVLRETADQALYEAKAQGRNAVLAVERRAPR